MAGGAATDAPGARLSPWRAGWLDIHHIATGRGDATLVMLPDGGSLLIDAGAAGEAPGVGAVRPGPERRPGQWIGRYVRRRLAESGRSRLDTLLVTHLHPDHVGAAGPQSPLAPGGAYRLTGVSDVAAEVEVGRLIDPDFPRYGDPAFEDTASAENYVAFVSDFARRGGRVERLAVGRADQIGLAVDWTGPAFEARALAARGVVWTGEGVETRRVFPDNASLPSAERYGENAASAALLLRYGRFSYFNAGDVTDWAEAGARPWMDALTPVARAAGPVTAAVAPHHGMFDATGSKAVEALRPRVWVVSAWHAAHPSPSVLARMLNEKLYPGPREVYVTELEPSVEKAVGFLTRRLASRRGHVVLRVPPSADRMQAVVTDSGDESDRVILAGAPIGLPDHV